MLENIGTGYVKFQNFISYIVAIIFLIAAISLFISYYKDKDKDKQKLRGGIILSVLSILIILVAYIRNRLVKKSALFRKFEGVEGTVAGLDTISRIVRR